MSVIGTRRINYDKKNLALAVGYERISAEGANQILPPRANPPLGAAAGDTKTLIACTSRLVITLHTDPRIVPRILPKLVS